MQEFHARSVFFVSDTPRAMAFYTDTLGFRLDWTYEEKDRPYVVQVSLHGMQIILNQAEGAERNRPGHGRVFAGLEEDQTAALLQHIEDRRIAATYAHWGAPTLVIRDLDQNELFFWLSDAERDRWRQANEGKTG